MPAKKIPMTDEDKAILLRRLQTMLSPPPAEPVQAPGSTVQPVPMAQQAPALSREDRARAMVTSRLSRLPQNLSVPLQQRLQQAEAQHAAIMQRAAALRQVNPSAAQSLQQYAEQRRMQIGQAIGRAIAEAEQEFSQQSSMNVMGKTK